MIGAEIQTEVAKLYTLQLGRFGATVTFLPLGRDPIPVVLLRTGRVPGQLPSYSAENSPESKEISSEFPVSVDVLFGTMADSGFDNIPAAGDSFTVDGSTYPAFLVKTDDAGGLFIYLARLSQQIAIERLRDDAQNDGYGNSRKNWITLVDDTFVYDKVPAEILPVTAPKTYSAGLKIETHATHTVTILYIAGLTVAMRIKFGVRTFTISSIVDIRERGLFLKLVCKEQFG